MPVPRTAEPEAGAGGAPGDPGAPDAPPRVEARREVAARRDHVLILCACVGVIAAALLLGLVAPSAGGGAGERIALFGRPLPEVCLFKAATGVPCPGCGLTRSWVAAVHGDLSGSRAFHPLGWVLLLYVGAQALRHGAWLAAPAFRGPIDAGGRWLDRGLVVLVVLLVVVWAPTPVRVLAEALSTAGPVG